MEGREGVPTPRKERPAGVALAAVLLTFSSGAGLISRLLGEFNDTLAIAWIALHVLILVTAIGLWRLESWAFWAWVALAGLGILQSFSRSVAGEAPGIYAVLRACVIGLWVAYFFRPHARAAFRDAV